MTGRQWQTLLDVISGKVVEPLPVGFIIDSPWLPGWAQVTQTDYFSDDRVWLDANLRALRCFPDIMFLPGFWAEFGMCTEPSAFGAKCFWQPDGLPFAHRVIDTIEDADSIHKPDPSKDGLLPRALERLKDAQDKIGHEGHAIRFAVSRGPLNIASFLVGTTEFLTGIRAAPDKVQVLLDTVTDFVIDWLRLQAQTFPSIDGIFILDDIIGFLGDADFIQFAKPCLKRIFGCLDASVRFFHNDAAGLVCAPHLKDIGVNLFNFSSDHPLAQMQELAGSAVTLVGNIPPRDVLAAGTPAEINRAVLAMLGSLKDRRRIIASCGGGMPPSVSTQNINAFLETVQMQR